MSSSDVAILTLAGAGYLIWPIYRIVIRKRRPATNTMLKTIFLILVTIAAFSLIAMFIGLHTNATDAGDLIMNVWGFGLLAFVGSVITLTVSSIFTLFSRNK